MTRYGEMMEPARVVSWKLLGLIVGAGLLLRGAIFVGAENALEASEAIVANMALDILDGTALPFFFYGTTYNGGGALEAYLAAASFALLGPSAAALKLWILALWLASACLFADLCRRTLTRAAAILAVAFFALGTPFFLEWSLKARGGFIETVLFSILLLWLARPPDAPRPRGDLRLALFGLSIGVGIWSSEMLLAMIPCAGTWLVLGLQPNERKRALRLLGTYVVIGLIPLLLYNLSHDWQNLRSSVLFKILQPSNTLPLTLSQAEVSAAFVLGRAWPLLSFLFVLAGVRILRLRDGVQLGHIALAHAVFYLAAYWLSGERYLSVPPSRVLFALYPTLALLFAYALAPPRRGGLAIRGLVAAAVAAWALAVVSSTFWWISSGQPREAGSWRGSWALTDGDELHRHLVSLNIERVYTSWWTVPHLEFAQRSARASGAVQPVQLAVSAMIPERAPEGQENTAIVLLRRGELSRYVEALLERQAISHRREDWNAHVIFHGIRASQIHQGIELPPVLAQTDWPAEPTLPDGFN